MQIENLINDAVEMYVTVINPYGENNAPFDSEEEYIESLKHDFREREYVLEYMDQGSDVPAFVDLCQMILDRLPIEEHIAIDRYDQVEEERVEPVVVLNEEFNMEKYKAAQKEAYELLKKTGCFAVIYAYTTGKERIILDKPIEKRSQQEVWDFVDSFKTGKQASKVVVDVFYKSKMSFYDEYFNNDVNERLVVEEYKVEKDWHQGSQTVLKRDSDEYKKLEYVADRLQRTSANDWTYYPADTYLDFGQGWQWTTILCKDNRQHEHQVLDSSEWFDIMNAKTNAELDTVVRTIKSGEWFQDRIRLESIVDAMRYED